MKLSMSIKPKMAKTFPAFICILFVFYISIGALAQPGRYGAISGIVTDSWTNNPLANVTVVVDSISSVTDSSGAFLFNYLSPGAYDVCCWCLDFADTCLEEILVIADSVTSINVLQRHLSVGIQFIDTFYFPYYGATRIAIKDDHAYINSELDGLLVLDISNIDSLALVGRLSDITYPIFDLKLRGDYAYLGSGTIAIVNISNPHYPVLIGEDLLNGYGRSLSLQGQYAFTAAGPYFYAYDISNLRDPTLIGILQYGSELHDFLDVKTQGNYAYTADLNHGLSIINITNPANLAIVGVSPINYSTSLYVRGRYVYFVGDSPKSLRIIDVSNPSSPNLVGSTRISNGGNNIVVQGDYAYIAGGIFQIVNISNPTRPTLFRQFNTISPVWDLCLSNDYIYLAGGNYLTILRLTNMPGGNIEGYVNDLNGNPIEGVEIKLADSRVKTTTDVQGHFLLDQIHTGPCSLSYSCPGFVENGLGNINVNYHYTTRVDITLAPNCIIRGAVFDTSHTAILGAFVKISGKDISAVTDSIGSFELNGLRPGTYSLAISHSDFHDSIFQDINVMLGDTTIFVGLLRPSGEVDFVGSCFNTGNAYGMAIRGNYLYTASSNLGVQIMDISNPQAPVRINRYGFAGNAWEICLQDNKAYIAGGSYGLEVVDITNPTSPIHYGAYRSDSAISIDVQGYYAFLLEGEWYEDGSMYILNINNPAQPFLVGRYLLPVNLGARRHVRVRGNYAYVNFSDTFLIIDISDPANPHLEGSIPTFMRGALEGLFLSGNYAYVGEIDRNLFRIINISDPANPTHAGIYYDFGESPPLNIWVQDDFAYMANYLDGIKILDMANNFSHPSLSGSFDTEGMTFGVLVSGDYIYTATDYYFFILKYQGYGQIVGTVSNDSMALVNAIIRVENYPQTDTTDLVGRFALSGIHPGLRQLSISHQLYPDTTLDVDVLIGNTSKLDIRLGIATGLNPEQLPIPLTFSLSQNYPNPFNPATTIKYSVASGCAVRLTVFNILGQKVTTLLNAPEAAGEHQIIWNASAFPSGLYFARLEAGEKRQTIKMVLLK